MTRLGAPFKVYQPDVSPFRIEVAKRIAAVNRAAGMPGDWPVPAADRARVRTEVAREFFRAEYGRDPDGARELAATIAKHSRRQTQTVAGYDKTPLIGVRRARPPLTTDLAARSAPRG